MGSTLLQCVVDDFPPFIVISERSILVTSVQINSIDIELRMPWMRLILLRNSIRRGLRRVVLIPRKLHVVAVPRNPPFKTTLREGEDEELWRARETLDGKDQSTILHKVSAIRMFNEWRPGWGLWVTGMVKGCPGCNPCLFRVPFNHPVKSGESSEKQTTFYDIQGILVLLAQLVWRNGQQIDPNCECWQGF